MNARTEWRNAWRIARIIHASEPANLDALAKFSGAIWLAILRRMDRDRNDPLSSPPEVNREVNRIIDSILRD